MSTADDKIALVQGLIDRALRRIADDFERDCEAFERLSPAEQQAQSLRNWQALIAPQENSHE
jgi:hypothetical protein